MTEINELRERVEAAEERFGLIDEQQRHYSDRVIGLIETIEAQLATARSEIENQIAEEQRLGLENEELRGMLHTVMRSIEEKTFTQTMQNLEARVCALVSGARPAESQAPAPAEEPAGMAAAAAEPEEMTAEADGAAEPEIDAMVEPESAAAAEDEPEMVLDAGPGRKIRKNPPMRCRQPRPRS